MDEDDCPSFARHAFKKQKDQNMSWYKSLNSVQRSLEQEERRRLRRPSQIRSALRNGSLNVWNIDRMANSKLGFYNTIKHEFVEEDYIRLDLNNNAFKRIAQIRTS
jgi:hypothetical protein